jgi:DNA-binding transcriptional MerR regulator
MTNESRLPATRPSPLPGRPEQANLADILERVLDKGIVIAGDIQINLLDIELLTIKLRLLIASVERAQEMGINWWEGDPALSSPRDSEADDDDDEGGRKQLEQQNQELRERIERLEQRLEQQPQGGQQQSTQQQGGQQRQQGGAGG